MTPHLIAALSRLSSLTPAELAVVGATAGTLAAQGGPVTRASTPRPAASETPPCLNVPRIPLGSALENGRLDLLTTTSWVEGLAVDPDLFASAVYRARIGVTVPTLFYIAGCEGLKHLADLIGRTVFKPGVTAGTTPALRLSSLAAARYGAVVQVGDRWVEEEGFDFFNALALPLQRRRGRGSPVQPALRAIAVDRPASLPLNVLDQAVRTGLERASLARFCAGANATVLCRERKIDPALLQRYTPGPRGTGAQRRPKRATELAIIGPRADADHIGDLVERIVAGHVMGTDLDDGARA